MDLATNLVERATALALRAHEGQTRKDGHIPYAAHPIAVALLVARHGFADAVIAAALAHDVLEDTSIGEEELRAAIGDEAAGIVRAVTNDASLPWKGKKHAYIEAVRAGSDAVKAVATADKIRNAESLVAAHARLGPAVWEAFNASRGDKLWFEEAMLAMLRETWAHPLVEEYATAVTRLRTLA